MNQFIKALDAIRKMETGVNSCVRAIDDLELIISIAQNRPPLGQSDSSISPSAWTKMRDLCKEYRALTSSLSELANPGIKP